MGGRGREREREGEGGAERERGGSVCVGVGWGGWGRGGVCIRRQARAGLRRAAGERRLRAASQPPRRLPTARHRTLAPSPRPARPCAAPLTCARSCSRSARPCRAAASASAAAAAAWQQEGVGPRGVQAQTRQGASRAASRLLSSPAGQAGCCCMPEAPQAARGAQRRQGVASLAAGALACGPTGGGKQSGRQYRAVPPAAAACTARPPPRSAPPQHPAARPAPRPPPAGGAAPPPTPPTRPGAAAAPAPPAAQHSRAGRGRAEQRSITAAQHTKYTPMVYAFKPISPSKRRPSTLERPCTGRRGPTQARRGQRRISSRQQAARVAACLFAGVHPQLQLLLHLLQGCQLSSQRLPARRLLLLLVLQLCRRRLVPRPLLGALAPEHGGSGGGAQRGAARRRAPKERQLQVWSWAGAGGGVGEGGRVGDGAGCCLGAGSG